jgi:hypothetical protein
MTILPADYRNSVEHYDATWQLLDETLYRVCRENPGHHSRAAVYGKLYLIGRTYATGVERKIATSGAQGSSISQVADYLLRNGEKVDRLLGELGVIREPLTVDGLRSLASVHGRFVRLMARVTQRGQGLRSFVSKYLHFHNPAVPIYDSVADGVLPSLVRWSETPIIPDMPENADPSYGWYLMRFFELYGRLREKQLQVTVKHLDNYLLWLAERKRARALRVTRTGTA